MGGHSRHQKETPLTIPLERVCCDERHIRRSDFSLDSLKNTIEDAGLLQPILVRKAGDSGFKVIDGARRLAALAELGVTELIVGRDIVIDVEETEADARFKQIIANVQREDLNAVELGHSFVAMKEEFGYQFNEVAEIIGKTAHYVAAKVGLAKRLSDEVQQLYVEDLDREKCIQNTFSVEPRPYYIMNINILEDIARLPAGMQRSAYEAIRSREMDKKVALEYLRILKQQAIAVAPPDMAESTVACLEDGNRQSGSLQRHMHRISRDIEKLMDRVSSGDHAEREEVIPEIEKLIEKLSALYTQIKGKESDITEGVPG